MGIFVVEIYESLAFWFVARRLKINFFPSNLKQMQMKDMRGPLPFSENVPELDKEAYYTAKDVFYNTLHRLYPATQDPKDILNGFVEIVDIYKKYPLESSDVKSGIALMAYQLGSMFANIVYKGKAADEYKSSIKNILNLQ